MQVVAIMNQKGGVGKTTTTLNLAHGLALQGKQVLILDLDPQGHLGSCFAIDTFNSKGMDRVLINKASFQEVTQNVRDNLFVVSAGAKLGELETQAQEGGRIGYRLYHALYSDTHNNDHECYIKQFDYILMDCPPASGLLAMNAILACNEFIIPVTGDYLALQGLSRLIKVISHIEQTLERHTKKWFVLTRFQKQRKLAQQIRQKMVGYFPEQVLATAIRENVALAESPGFAKSIFEYQPRSNGAEDYKNLVIDFLEQRTITQS